MASSTAFVSVCALALTAVTAAFLIVAGQMSDDEHKGIVELHNRLRRSVFPEAADMNLVVESSSLRALAQRAADTCLFQHNYGGDYDGKGENLYKGGSNASLAVMLWFTERENYQLSATSELCGKDHGNGRYPNHNSCGHYYQIVQHTVKEIGCGRKNCSDGCLIVCEYNAGAGSPPYTAGKACSKCSRDYPRCLDGLCAPVGTSGSSCQLDCTACNKLVGLNSNSDSQCSCSGTHSPCTQCHKSATPCLNNGTDNLASSSCSCTCPTGFYGDQCQYNRAEFASAIQLRFGGELHKKSYFPVPKSFWPGLWRALAGPLTNLLTDFCRANFAVCCPGAAGPPTANANFLSAGDLRVAASGLNVTATGELAVSLVAPAASAAGFCGTSSSPGSYVSLASVPVLAHLMGQRELLANATFACCGVNLTAVTSGVDQVYHWPQGEGTGGAGGCGWDGSGGSGSGGGGKGALTLSAGKQLNSVSTALFFLVSVTRIG